MPINKENLTQPQRDGLVHDGIVRILAQKLESGSEEEKQKWRDEFLVYGKTEAERQKEYSDIADKVIKDDTINLKEQGSIKLVDFSVWGWKPVPTDYKEKFLDSEIDLLNRKETGELTDAAKEAEDKVRKQFSPDPDATPEENAKKQEENEKIAKAVGLAVDANTNNSTKSWAGGASWGNIFWGFISFVLDWLSGNAKGSLADYIATETANNLETSVKTEMKNAGFDDSKANSLGAMVRHDVFKGKEYHDLRPVPEPEKKSETKTEQPAAQDAADKQAQKTDTYQQEVEAQAKLAEQEKNAKAETEKQRLAEEQKQKAAEAKAAADNAAKLKAENASASAIAAAETAALAAKEAAKKATLAKAAQEVKIAEAKAKEEKTAQAKKQNEAGNNKTEALVKEMVSKVMQANGGVNEEQLNHSTTVIMKVLEQDKYKNGNIDKKALASDVANALLADKVTGNSLRKNFEKTQVEAMVGINAESATGVGLSGIEIDDNKKNELENIAIKSGKYAGMGDGHGLKYKIQQQLDGGYAEKLQKQLMVSSINLNFKMDDYGKGFGATGGLGSQQHRNGARVEQTALG